MRSRQIIKIGVFYKSVEVELEAGSIGVVFIEV